jgi:PAS domain-containing protein
MTSHSELVEFLSRLQDHRSRLDDLGRGEPAGDSAASARQLDEMAALGEALLVAEEELRAQHEELAAVRMELDRVLARNEELFGYSSAAHVITDVRGMIVEADRAAQQLLGVTQPRLRRPLVSMFTPPYRRTIRALTSLAAVGGGAQTGEIGLRRGGREQLLDVSVDLRTEPHTGAALLRWRFTSRSAEQHPLLRLVAADGTRSDTPAPGGLNRDGELSRLLALARADLAGELSGERGPEVLLTRIVELTLRWVPGTEHASVTRVVDEHRLRSAAATDAAASDCDELENLAGQGPAFEAIRAHTTVRVDDLSRDRRWPKLARKSGETSVRSILVCELPVTRGAPATLNLYSSRPAAFTALAELVAPVFAARASIAMGHTDDVHNLEQAIAYRQTIGQAVGILMERHKLTPDDAFGRLVTASQTSHIKLREIAAQVVETGEEPNDVSPSWAATTPKAAAHVPAGDSPASERTHEQVPVPPGPIADLTVRLFAEFSPLLPLDTVLEIVRQCCRDLDTTPEAALPELVEQLARQRLLIETYQHPAGSD